MNTVAVQESLMKSPVKVTVSPPVRPMYCGSMLVNVGVAPYVTLLEGSTVVETPSSQTFGVQS